MRIAFYAPMKSPAHTRPSGDRTIARLLMTALEKAGHDVRIASELRTWSSEPAPKVLRQLRAQSEIATEKLLEHYRAHQSAWVPEIWFTYHNYYKAPDFLGPGLSDQLGIPYVIAEASYSPRRRDSGWRDWLAVAEQGIRRADAVFTLTHRDRSALSGLVPDQHHHLLLPFLDLGQFPAPRKPASSPSRIVTVAMMRAGAKLQSYQLLADSLCRLDDLEWSLDIVGDGAVRTRVEAAFDNKFHHRVRWHGALTGDDVQKVLQQGSLFAWPGIDEAFGMAYLEAQACGLPVAACETAGVPTVVSHGESGLLASETNADSFAAVLRQLLTDTDLRNRLAINARRSVEKRHSIETASHQLHSVLAGFVTANQVKNDSR